VRDLATDCGFPNDCLAFRPTAHLITIAWPSGEVLTVRLVKHLASDGAISASQLSYSCGGAGTLGAIPRQSLGNRSAIARQSLGNPLAVFTAGLGAIP
jgi:hypothetical protein